MKRLKPLLELFYPSCCVSCDGNLLSNEELICTECRHDLPFFDNHTYLDNVLHETLKGKVAIVYAGAFFQYRKFGKVKQLIHNLKYRGHQEIGTLIGKWWGSELNSYKHLEGVDCILPVPLHKRKQKTRGYNQLTTFGIALSEELKIPFIENILIRKTATKTQTYKKRFERFLNTETIFELADTDFFQNKHVLLIDDVITTGATIESCCKELLKSKNIKISILTIAFTL